MYPDGLVFGVAHAPSPTGDPTLTLKLRDLTISWSRYDYRGRILEAATIEDVLDQAVELGYRWCLVQAPGHIILEEWRADAASKRLDECVSDWVRERNFLVLGALVSGDGGHGLDDQCLLVDVDRYREVGRAAFRGVPVCDVGAELVERRVSLGRLSPPDRRRLGRYLERGIRTYAAGQTWGEPGVDAFLTGVQRQVLNAERGVFLWNLEPYDDVQTPPRGFEPPISTLYSVAAGFKPNAILEALGFGAETRVVFFDYSANALQVKRLLLDKWDGRDFPTFVRSLFRRLPPPEAHYHLSDDATAETIGDHELEAAWERELEQWGGEQGFVEHWSRYRQLRHEFVHCNVLSDATRLLALVEAEPDAVIWWSNAFFTVWGNWLLDASARTSAYRRWAEELAERNPDLFLYGSDFSNSSVNDIHAAEYWGLLRDAKADELVPLGANACEIRF
jgi:hypothetical protein